MLTTSKILIGFTELQIINEPREKLRFGEQYDRVRNNIYESIINFVNKF